MRGYTDKVAACLGIAKERVAVRGEEVLTTVDFGDTGFMKDSLYVTPVGICTNYYTQKNSFVFVNVNNERIKMYDNNHLTVVDAVMQIGFPNDKLFPRRGEELEFTVNGKSRLVRGTPGEGAEVFLNGKRANLNSRIEQNDVIEVHESTAGEPAHITIGQLEEYNSTITFIVNDKKVTADNMEVKAGETLDVTLQNDNGTVVKVTFYNGSLKMSQQADDCSIMRVVIDSDAFVNVSDIEKLKKQQEREETRLAEEEAAKQAEKEAEEKEEK
mgnify:CR=1 FL=1